MDKMLSTFQIFNFGYFVYLLFAIGVVLALVLLLRKLTDKNVLVSKVAIISAIGLFCILEFVGRLIGTKNIRLGDQMPFELWDVFAVMSIVMFFVKKPGLKKFGYLIIAPVSLYSMIFVPSMYSAFSTISLAILSFYLLQALIISNAILNMLWDEEELEKKDILNASITYLIIVSCAHLLNVFFRFTAIGVHANYMGTMGEEYDTIIGFIYKLIPVPFVCILPMVAVLVGIEFLLILPFDLIKTKKKNQSEIEELIALGNLKAQAEYRKNHKSSGSQILVKSETKASPKTDKNTVSTQKSGFVETTKQVKVNNEKNEK